MGWDLQLQPWEFTLDLLSTKSQPSGGGDERDGRNGRMGRMIVGREWPEMVMGYNLVQSVL